VARTLAMPPAKNAKIWNTDLIRACEARRAEVNAKQSRSEFQWFNAKQRLEATDKQIYITSTDSIKNLPDGLSKSVSDYLHSVIRGRVSVDSAAGLGDGGERDCGHGPPQAHAIHSVARRPGWRLISFA
jgi:hypothetical protein